MPTGQILLPITAASVPDGTGSGNAPAGLLMIVSSGTQTSNTPKVHVPVATFDAATDEHLMWTLVLPSNYSSTPTLTPYYSMASATSGNTVWKAAAIVGGATADLDAGVFLAAATVTSAVPGTVGYVKSAGAISLTATGFAADTQIIVTLGRDADNGSDTASGDAYLHHVVLSYTST